MGQMELRAKVEQALGVDPDRPAVWRSLGEGVGGSRSRVSVGKESGFVKFSGDGAELFEAEADGLRALAGTGAIRVPSVVWVGSREAEACLLLEWLPLAAKTSVAAAKLGEWLARQHLAYGERFGWRRHNFIGTTPQFNTPADEWPAFFAEHRLKFQLRLAAENSYGGTLQESGARLLEVLPRFFAGHRPRPSLLHGDLWGGNWGALPSGEPVVFDPAVYWGDREADLAMTELFGGFGTEFYAAYRQHASLDVGYSVRRELYNLYHVLNHLNLFGGSYLDQALDIQRRLLAEVG